MCGRSCGSSVDPLWKDSIKIVCYVQKKEARRVSTARLATDFKIPAKRESGRFKKALFRTGVKVTSVAVTLKQWWRDVGLCPRPPRASVSPLSPCHHHCRRNRPMGHSFSMCKLQECRHKKSKGASIFFYAATKGTLTYL